MARPSRDRPPATRARGQDRSRHPRGRFEPFARGCRGPAPYSRTVKRRGAPSRVHTSVEVPADQPAEERMQLRRREEVAGPGRARATGCVVAEVRFRQRALHEARERDPATRRVVDLASDQLDEFPFSCRWRFGMRRSPAGRLRLQGTRALSWAARTRRRRARGSSAADPARSHSALRRRPARRWPSARLAAGCSHRSRPSRHRP